MLRVLLPGEELDANDRFQYTEIEMMGRADYDFIIENGYQAWFMQFLPKIRSDISPGRLSAS